jgi:heme exporter protein A
MEASGLTAWELFCRRGDRLLFGSLDLRADKGAAIHLVGPNGIGKTSLLRILAGLTRPTEGSVRWRGEPIAALGEDYGRDMLYLGHAPGVKDELSVGENLAFATALSGIRAGGLALESALEQLGIARLASLPARHLSQGQRRRAALARLPLASTVPLWLLDEPFAALDDEAIERLRALAAAHLAAGGIVVLTSHQEVEIAAPAVQTLRLGTAS